jgi:hypothetical protein
MSHIKLAPVHGFATWARDRTFPSKDAYEAALAAWEARQPEIDAIEKDQSELVKAAEGLFDAVCALEDTELPYDNAMLLGQASIDLRAALNKVKP